MDKTLIIPIRLGLANAYLLVERDKSVLVDGGYPGADIASALARMGPARTEPGLAVVTHAHTDHFGGLVSYAATRPALRIAVGASDAEGLAQGRNVDLVPLGFTGRLAGLVAGSPEAGGKGLTPTLLFRGGESLSPYGITAEIVATPGHTKGSLSIFIPNAADETGQEIGAAAVIGDLVMGGFLLSRRPRPPFFASGMDALRRSLDILESRSVGVLYPGHGGPLSARRAFSRFGVKRR